MALFDAFLKLDGIKGESVDSNHKGESDILSFSWGASQAAVQTPGSRGGAGKVHFQDIQFVKKTDSASPLLMLHCASGEHIKEANFVVRRRPTTGIPQDQTDRCADLELQGAREYPERRRNAAGTNLAELLQSGIPIPTAGRRWQSTGRPDHCRVGREGERQGLAGQQEERRKFRWQSTYS